MRQCKYCYGEIPTSRRKDALYCSDECYKQQKRQRDSSNYAESRAYLNKIKKNEKLLRQFYPICDKGESIPFRYLDWLGFDWGLHTGETLHQSQILPKIGQYAYFIDKLNQTVLIWKLGARRLPPKYDLHNQK